MSVSGPSAGTSYRGRTVLDLLDDAARRHPNEHALNQRDASGTERSFGLDELRIESQDVALGLLDLGLEPGDRIGLFLESDAHFCRVDFGCLRAGLVDAPIYLSHDTEQIRHVLADSGAKALVVGDDELLERAAAALPGTAVRHVVVVDETAAGSDSAALLSDDVRLHALLAIRARGQERRAALGGDPAAALPTVQPSDTATLIYTSGTTGKPKGVMLSHENLAFNALSAMAGFRDYTPGADGEWALSFLPLTHSFARTLLNGMISQGTSVTFTTPERLREDLVAVRPTIFAAVPRVLERFWEAIRERAEGGGLQAGLLRWAIGVAEDYRIGEEPRGWKALRHRLADALVFRRWRQAMGGRISFIVVGGAAIDPALLHRFAAAGIRVIEGYGLTESSPVIAYNRPHRNRPGTVGEPIEGVEVKIEAGEILTRGPHVMQGYWGLADATGEVVDSEGWLKTGDLGSYEDGVLTVTGRKKEQFKLSTGEFVTPGPAERAIRESPAIERVLVLGEGRKYCAALLLPSEQGLRSLAREAGERGDAPLDELVRNPAVARLLAPEVERANRDLTGPSQIKRYTVLPVEPTLENGLLTPTLKLRKNEIRDRYADAVAHLYEADVEDDRSGALFVPAPAGH